MSITKIVGIVLVGVGVILLFFAYQSSQAVGDQVTELLTGRFTDKTMWYLISGVAALIGGLFLSIFRKR